MPDGLYEVDALAWAEQQASLLRRVAAGERLNDAVDWDHVIAEVQDVGLSELRACRSLLRQALVHIMKLHAWPESPAAAHWRGEIAGISSDARDRFTPSMRQRISIGEVYADALYEVRSGSDEIFSGPEICPVSLEHLVSDRPDVAELTRRFGG